MVTQQEINEKFMEVIRWLKAKGYSQSKICEKAKIAVNAISKIKNGHNNVGDETINKLCDAFDLNSDYIYGRSPYKTLKELNDKEECEKSNMQDVFHTSFDFSIIIEKAVEKATSFADETIASLKKQVADKDMQIEDLRKTIALQAQRIQELESYAKQYSDEDAIRNWPFKMGVADERKQPTEQP